VADIAAQAGLVLRNVRLNAALAASLEEISARTEELRASRQRIVAVQDAERRQVERDIHDGAQQHLVALMVHLGLVRRLIERDPTKAAAMVPNLRAVTTGALATLHDLALGIHPPLLRERGRTDALAAQVTNPNVAVTVEAEGIGRYAPEVEAAVYFACLEALQNVSKHAPGSRVVVHLVVDDASLEFSVTDDGAGFDPERCRPGSGLANMADRLAALGGSVDVASLPGRGTTVLGRLPSPTREPVS
jgi:signal transduction histidine kinase